MQISFWIYEFKKHVNSLAQNKNFIYNRSFLIIVLGLNILCGIWCVDMNTSCIKGFHIKQSIDKVVATTENLILIVP